MSPAFCTRADFRGFLDGLILHEVLQWHGMVTGAAARVLFRIKTANRVGGRADAGCRKLGQSLGE